MFGVGSAAAFAELDDDALTARVVELEAEQRALDVERLSALGEWHRRQAWANDGSVNAACRLARDTRIDRRTAHARMQVASKLTGMPHVRAAAEELGWSKVRVLAMACEERTAQAFVVAEERLVEQALDLSADQLACLLTHWKRLIDADGALGDADSMHDRSFLAIDESWAGEGFLKGRLDPESLAIVREALDEIMDELYRSDRRARAQAMLEGLDPEPAATPSRRAAEALVEMARRSRYVTSAHDGAAEEPSPSPSPPMRFRSTPRPLLIVHADIDARGELAARFPSGAPVDPVTSARLACDAAVVAVISDGRDVPLRLGRTVRDPSDGQRRALSAIWGGCAHPTCDRPFAWCQLHHVHWWERGGPTDIELLIPLCSRHHHLHHAGVFTIERSPSGTFHFARADGSPIGAANPTITRLLAAARAIAADCGTAA